MKRLKEKGVEWLEFEHLSARKEVVHGVFLKHGGVSEGAFNSLNVGFSAGDDLQCVEENIKRVAGALQVSALFSPLQCHGDAIVEIKEPTITPIVCDGLITQLRDFGLMIKHADCQAAIFFDPITMSIGCVHSGWRGSVKNIYKKCVERMKESFGTEPSDLLVGISPSLGPAAAEFRNYKDELPPAFWPFQVRENYFDFWTISRMQLEKCGILRENIEIANICTYSTPEDLFSYRLEKRSGRNATLVALQA